MTDFARVRNCHHDSPEPVVLSSRSGHRWCVVRCAVCGRRLGGRTVALRRRFPVARG